MTNESERRRGVVTGEVDADNCVVFANQLLEVMEPPTDLDLDLSALSFIDSSGISELLRVRGIYVDAGLEIRIVDPSSAVRRVLEITGLLSAFHLD